MQVSKNENKGKYSLLFILPKIDLIQFNCAQEINLSIIIGCDANVHNVI